MLSFKNTFIISYLWFYLYYEIFSLAAKIYENHLWLHYYSQHFSYKNKTTKKNSIIKEGIWEENASHFNITYLRINVFLLTTTDFTNNIFKDVQLLSISYIFWKSPLLPDPCYKNFLKECLNYWNVNIIVGMNRLTYLCLCLSSYW